MLKTSAVLAGLLSVSYGWTPAVLARALNSRATSSSCASLSGSFNITSDLTKTLHPENAVYHADKGALYMSLLYESRVGILPCGSNKIESVIEFKNLTESFVEGTSGNSTSPKPLDLSDDPTLHASGLELDLPRNRLTVIVEAGDAFDSFGQNIEGPNYVISVDLETKQPVFVVDLTKSAPKDYGGIQDIEHDDDGNIFVVWTWGGRLTRIVPDPKKPVVTEWYRSEKPKPAKALTGIAKFDSTTLLVADQTDAQLYRFSTKDESVREKVQIADGGRLDDTVDGIYLPPKYGGCVILVSDDFNGTWVLSSNDQWKTATKHGVVPSEYGPNGSTTATVEVEGSIFAINEFFGAKDVKSFPLTDITDRVEALLSNTTLSCGKGSNGGSNGTAPTQSGPLVSGSSKTGATLSMFAGMFFAVLLL
ncbi:hypothetical protein CDD83_7438 [Cordyceps sp. RAO-2017]|nr:hypothetical protein CDD83_7438 [Cordyceps sp. RAO-2017]